MNPTPAAVAIPGYLAGTWKADPVHSEIGLSVRQLMVGKIRGQFTSYDITIVTSQDPLGSSVAATIELASIDTGNERRDNHLRSADFFDVETYPTMSYRSTGIRQTDDGWIIDGELTSQRAALGIRFVSVLPQLTPATALGAVFAAAYAARQGADAAPSTSGPPLTPEQAGQAIVDLTGPGWDQDAYLLTAAGLRPLP